MIVYADLLTFYVFDRNFLEYIEVSTPLVAHYTPEKQATAMIINIHIDSLNLNANKTVPKLMMYA